MAVQSAIRNARLAAHAAPYAVSSGRRTTSTGSSQARLVATVARVAIVLLTGAMALRQMGLANDIINLAFGLIVGAAAVAVAIAFGIGGRDLAARQLENWSRKAEPED